MSAAKKKKQTSAVRFPPWLSKPVAVLCGPARSVTLIALLVAGLVGAWCAVWYGAGVRDHVLGSAAYELTVEDVEITPRPSWIDTDIREDVFRNGSLDGRLSIMDDDLLQRIGNAFALNPWVAEVVGVRKRHPAQVQVDLIYRRPACAVAVSTGWLPVDGQGVLLPREAFSIAAITRLPRLVKVDTLPMGMVGESWGDPRVIGGAEVASALNEVWDELLLAEIEPSDPLSGGPSGEHSYTLITRGGTRIHFGRAPGTRAPGEMPVDEKIARLRQYVAEQGTLEGRGGPQQLDVYSLQAMRAPTRPKR